MRRLQHGFGMLIALFALTGVLMLTGCKKEETTGDKIDKATEKAGDKMDKAADEAADKVNDAMNENK